MKKTLLTLSVLAMAAVMSSCGGNSNNAANAPADTTSCCQPKCEKSEAAGAQCTEKKSGDCCSEAAAKSDAAPAVDLTKKYVCPNRDGSSDTPGECPACGMDLIEN